ncbi:Ribosome-binding factor A [hydrothermal vent metagenome]|uniref:Ribosome-binding factor A n=1 Tax=hydrothermal vent metagenome TaxID=652676 RepID=A0A1W1CJI3_9ZZZZ
MNDINIRLQRIDELIKRELVLLFKNKVNDPRFKKVRVVDVQTSRDLGLSKIFFSLDAEDKSLTKLLNQKQGFFRHQISQSIELRHTPQLKFIYDNTPISSARIEQLLANL